MHAWMKDLLCASLIGFCPCTKLFSDCSRDLITLFTIEMVKWSLNEGINNSTLLICNFVIASKNITIETMEFEIFT